MKEVKLRRYQNLLTVSGLGVIGFAVWGVLKTILLMLLKQDYLEQVFADTTDKTAAMVIVIAILAAIILSELSVRLFVGLSARAEGFGKKKGYAYIIFAVLLVLISVLSLVALFFDASVTSVFELIVSVIVEATSLVVLIELLVAAFTVKKLKKEVGEV